MQAFIFFSALFVECLPPKYDVLCLRVVLILDLIQVGTDFWRISNEHKNLKGNTLPNKFNLLFI